MTNTIDLRGTPRSSPEHDSTSLNVESEAKRRKLRKGTHSCWGCKRRKIKCTFKSPADAICVGCSRRGVACVNQEFPEGGITLDMSSSIVRDGAMINQLAKMAGKESEGGSVQLKPTNTAAHSIDVDLTSERTSTVNETSEHISTRLSSLLTPASQVEHPDKATFPDASKYKTLSVTLHQAFPSQEDANLLYKSCKGIPLYCYQMNTRPYNKIKSEGIKLGKDSPEFLGPDTHPVLLARQMLIFASLIQESHTQHLEGLSESPETIKKRLADTAINMVTTNEELHGTTEGIECIILEAVFQLYSGNLRRAWLAYRRALTVGQLMGINRLHGPPLQRIDSNTKMNLQFMWFRIVYMDRTLSMMLGFPQGTTDKSMTSDSAMAGDTQMGKLVRSHAVIAARILELRDSDPCIQNPAPFQEIDMDLLKLANSQPPKFWLPPKSIRMEIGSEPYFWESMRVTNQLVHYNLVCQLHLSSLLRSDENQKYTCRYSKMACINASREALTRCITYPGFSDVGGCCWIFAIPASMTLILAHIDSHRPQDFDHVLAHQRMGDRGMIEKILEGMEILKRANGDASSENGENVLQWLLGIEAEVANGQNYSARSVNEQEGFQEDDNAMRISIPYFGVVKFTHEGRISKESPQTRWLNEQDDKFNDTGLTPLAPVDSLNNVSNISGLPFDPVGIDMGQVPQASAHTLPHPIDQQHLAAQFPNASNHLDTQQQYSYPSLTAGIEDWAFQGVDNAFLDNLMMGTRHRDDGTNWLPDWQSENSGGI